MNPKKYADKLKQMDFLVGADNVYLTENYIVKQEFSILVTKQGDSYSISRDTYYLRTKEREMNYLLAFQFRRNINGKRFIATTYTRTYVD